MRPTDIISAIELRDLGAAGSLLDAGADINAVSMTGHSANAGLTPLSLAVKQCWLEGVRWLLERGADADATAQPVHPLVRALDQLDAIRYRPVSGLTTRQAERRRADIGEIARLMAREANFQTSPAGQALWSACCATSDIRWNLVRTLVERRASWPTVDGQKQETLGMLVLRKNAPEDIIDKLAALGPLFSETIQTPAGSSNFWTALIAKARATVEDKMFMGKALQHRAWQANGRSAAQLGQDLVQLDVEVGAQVIHAPDFPLSSLPQEAKDDLLLSFITNISAAEQHVERLIQAGANPNAIRAQDDHETTPVSKAIALARGLRDGVPLVKRLDASIRVLLANGADIHQAPGGQPPPMTQALLNNVPTEILLTLIQAGGIFDIEKVDLGKLRADSAHLLQSKAIEQRLEHNTGPAAGLRTGPRL